MSCPPASSSSARKALHGIPLWAATFSFLSTGQEGEWMEGGGCEFPHVLPAQPASNHLFPRDAMPERQPSRPAPHGLARGSPVPLDRVMAQPQPLAACILCMYSMCSPSSYQIPRRAALACLSVTPHNCTSPSRRDVLGSPPLPPPPPELPSLPPCPSACSTAASGLIGALAMCVYMYSYVCVCVCVM